MVSFGAAHSKVVAAASCLFLKSGYNGVHMVHPLTWPTQPLEFPASPQHACRRSTWTSDKSRRTTPSTTR
jgi:hypothetical protein